MCFKLQLAVAFRRSLWPEKLSFQPYHIQVVKGHVMSIASEDEHVSLWINHSWMAISGCWLLSCYHAEVWFVRLSGVLGLVWLVLSLLHLLEVDIERLVSVLDDETVLHSDTRWWLKSIVGFFSRVQIVFRSPIWWGGHSSLLGGWTIGRHSRICWVSSFHRTAIVFTSLWWAVFLILNTCCLSLAVRVVPSSFIIWTELTSRKIKHNQIVKLFSQLKNTSENVKLATIHNSRVTTTCNRSVFILTNLNLAPGLRAQVKCPHVCQFIVVVVLSAKNEHLVFKNTRRQTCSKTGWCLARGL